MSRATKRKYVTKEVLEEFVEPSGDQEIVRVLCGRGNNLHEVESPMGKLYLVSMPTKFRRNVWIKRGNFVVVEPIAEGDKVKAEIVHILYPMQIRSLKEENKWPSRFTDKVDSKRNGDVDSYKQISGNESVYRERSGNESTEQDDDDDEEEEDDESDLFVNTNRPPPIVYDTESSSSEED